MNQSLPEPNDELIRKALFWSEAAFNLQGFLDLRVAQEHYILGESESAHVALKTYLEGTVKQGPSQ